MAALRLLQIALPQFVAVAAITALGVVLAARSGPQLAALVASLALAGGLVGFLAGSWLFRPHAGPSLPRVALLAWMVLTAASLLLVANVAAFPLVGAATFVAGACWSNVSVLTREAAGFWGQAWLRRVGPVGRVGAALGAVVGTLVALRLPPSVLILTLPLAFVCLPLLTSSADHGRPSRPWGWSAFSANLLLALCGYGPLSIHVAFVAATAGPAWAGASMTVYALAALCAPRLVSVLPSRLTRSPTAWLSLAALADVSWLLVLVHPVGGLLASRAFSAVALFAAEGSADVQAHARSALPAALAGRTLGTLLAGLLGTLLFGFTSSAVLIAALFASMAVAAAAALLVARKVAGNKETEAPAVQGVGY